MKIALATSEAVPFAKTGGLADVCGALPRALKEQKQNICLILPKYKKIDSDKFKLKKLPAKLRIPLNNRIVEGEIYQGELLSSGVGAEDRLKIPVYFVGNDDYYGREELYRTSTGDYPDNAERFIFFSRAVLETLKAVDFQPDVIHCHDWQTGLIPAYLKTIYQIDAFFNRTASLFTIHNIAYQGIFPVEIYRLAGFGPEDFVPERLEYYNQICFLKAGLIFADILTTVSPTYAQEIQSNAEFGRGMEGILQSRSRELYGVLNGIDLEQWDPATDRNLKVPYSAKDLSGKRECKADLQKVTGLPLDPNTPLFGMVSRLDPQKGLDILAAALPAVLKLGVQVVILGKGDQEYHDLLNDLSRRYPRQLSVQIKFDEVAAHKIYAGSDVFLMPSRFEPCGLGQMIAMRYATLPLVFHTGGLADTVIPYGSAKANGFLFRDYSADALLHCLTQAVKVYRTKNPDWQRLIKNALSADFSWERSIKEYIRLYQQARSRLT